MRETDDELERSLEAHFARERERMQPPASLWSRIDGGLGSAAAPRATFVRRRWRALVATILIASAIAAGLLVLSSLSGSDGGGGGPSLTAEEVLAGAVEAQENPDSVGLHTLRGVAETVAPADEECCDFPQTWPEGTPIESAEIPKDATRGEIRFWFDGQHRYRFEMDDLSDGREESGDRLMLTDGETSWLYHKRANAYVVSTGEGLDYALSGLRFRLAPAALAGASDIGELLVQLANSPGRRAELVGEETILGRPSYIVEITPADADSLSPPNNFDPPEGSVRFWLDKEFLFTLQMEESPKPDTTSEQMRFTEVAFNEDMPDNLFHFDPPAGAAQVRPIDLINATNPTPGGGGGTGDFGQEVDLPKGFLAPTLFLPGYHTRSIGSWYEGDTTTQAWFLIVETAGTSYISSHERRDLGYFPEALQRGETKELHGEDARLWNEDDLLHLAWQRDDLVVHLVARGVSEGDLVAVAESMDLSEGSDTLPGPDDGGRFRFGPGDEEDE